MTTSPSQAPHPMLRVESAGPVTTLTLTNPSRLNAQLPSLWTALARVGDGLADDVRVVVIKGEGRSFSAGMDRRMFTLEGVEGEVNAVALAAMARDDGVDPIPDVIADFQRGFEVWREVPAVVIAAVQGHALGAGFQLALAADLRVVADDVSLAMKETTLGLVPDLAGTRELVEAVGYSRALEICATGRVVGAAEAVAIGLATLAVPVADLDGAVTDLVDALLAAPPAALRALKPLLRGVRDRTPADQLRAEAEAQSGLLRLMARNAGPDQRR